MFELLAIPILITVIALIAAVLLRRNRARFAAHPVAYRIGFSALVASFAPTFVLGGHGGLPVPTLTGLIITLTRIRSFGDVRLTWIGFGSDQLGILIMPFVVAFLIIVATPFSKVSASKQPASGMT